MMPGAPRKGPQQNGEPTVVWSLPAARAVRGAQQGEGSSPGQKVSHSPASAFLAASAAAFLAVIRAISILSSSVFRGGRLASGGYVIY